MDAEGARPFLLQWDNFIDVVTMAGVAVVLITLVLEFRWRRRAQAMHIIELWDTRARPHIRKILKVYPLIRDGGAKFRRDSDIADLDSAEAERIYAAGDDDTRDLKNDMDELLNWLEYFALAYRRRVVDRALFDEGIRDSVIAWHGALLPYIRVVRGHPYHGMAWKVLTDQVQAWVDAHYRAIDREFTGKG